MPRRPRAESRERAWGGELVADRSIKGTATALILILGIGIGEALARDTVAPTAKREELARTSHVRGAHNRTMVLSRVEIPQGTTPALHHHLGTQIARIENGTLTYTVKDGSVIVRKGDSTDGGRFVRKIKAGQTGKIHAGQWIVEQPSDIHRAANRGTKRIVITLATLLEKGAPPSTPIP